MERPEHAEEAPGGSKARVPLPKRGALLIGGAVVGIAAVAMLLTLILVRGPGVPESATGGNVVRAIAADGSLQSGFAVGRGPAAAAMSTNALWV
ncbi:MAG TPA: hypothetical protein VES36_07225, partial [Candidatus Limnocylindrales bacterium]|nr:hypothetical protein [Candidatus Limnocylindrales bacterium]